MERKRGGRGGVLTKIERLWSLIEDKRNQESLEEERQLRRERGFDQLKTPPPW